ncbi:MAG: peptidylprolyl isomerase [Cyclobacteriaceae bacterium]|nr:peptidylprolyl isomerase [Cyclobacteriaceae bacterium SS2]
MKLHICAFLVLLAMGACDSGNKNEDALITIHTAFGDMKAILYEETPIHKQNFIRLAKSGKYDSTEWHRVIEDFMIQGGDVFAKEEKQEPMDDRLPAEFIEGLYHTKGALAAARQPDDRNPKKMSSSVQFYIVDGKVFSEEELTIDQFKLNENLGKLLSEERFADLREKYLEINQTGDVDSLQRFIFSLRELVESEYSVDLKRDFAPDRLEKYMTVGGAYHLDGNYTIFGRVVEGLDVIDKIAAVETGAGYKPVEPIYLTMEVEMVPKSTITQKYGYEYPPVE